MKRKLTAVRNRGKRELTRDESDHLWFQIGGYISCYRAPAENVSPWDQARALEITDVARELRVAGVLLHAAAVLRDALVKHAHESGLVDEWNAHIRKLDHDVKEAVSPDQIQKLFEAVSPASRRLKVG